VAVETAIDIAWGQFAFDASVSDGTDTADGLAVAGAEVGAGVVEQPKIPARSDTTSSRPMIFSLDDIVHLPFLMLVTIYIIAETESSA
jgi:hypothetical protein